jgi:hypothetical protein
VRCRELERVSLSHLRVLRDQVKNLLDLGPKRVAEPCALSFVANDRVTKLGFGFGIETNYHHRPKISLSIRRRTSAQSEVTASPESSAAHRRSISAAQATRVACRERDGSSSVVTEVCFYSFSDPRGTGYLVFALARDGRVADLHTEEFRPYPH